MKPLLLAAAVLFSGCLYSPPDASKPAPVPTPVVVTLDGASQQAIVDYSAGMADLCDSLATDVEAGKFKAQSQVADELHAKSQALREGIFNRLGKRMDAVIPPGTDLSANDTAAAYRKLALGFRKAAGK